MNNQIGFIVKNIGPKKTKVVKESKIKHKLFFWG